MHIYYKYIYIYIRTKNPNFETHPRRDVVVGRGRVAQRAGQADQHGA